MTTFDDRERGEEAKFRHDQEIAFKVRNRRNKLLGLWVAGEHLALSGDEALAYAKDVVMADFAVPGEADAMGKVRADLERAGKSALDHDLQRHHAEFEAKAKQEVMAECPLRATTTPAGARSAPGPRPRSGTRRRPRRRSRASPRAQ